MFNSKFARVDSKTVRAWSNSCCEINCPSNKCFAALEIRFAQPKIRLPLRHRRREFRFIQSTSSCPFLTFWPSLNKISCTTPSASPRTSTISLAATLPTNDNTSATGCDLAPTAITRGAIIGGGPDAFFLQPNSAVPTKANTIQQKYRLAGKISKSGFNVQRLFTATTQVKDSRFIARHIAWNCYAKGMISRRKFLAATAASASFPAILRAAEKPALHLGLIADPQYADIDPIATRYYRQSIGKLTEAVDHFNSLELDFCVNVGDTIDQQWQSFDAILKPLEKSKHKFHHILGNHDFDLPDDQKAKSPARLGMPAKVLHLRARRILFRIPRHERHQSLRLLA